MNFNNSAIDQMKPRDSQCLNTKNEIKIDKKQLQ